MPAASAPAHTSSRRTSVSVSDPWTANVTASAANTSARPQPSVDETPRTPSVRARSAPGARTTASPKTSWSRSQRPLIAACSASSREQPVDVPRAEPGGCLAVVAAALAAVQPAAHEERGAQELSRVLRRAGPSVERQVAQVPAYVLAEHPAAVRRPANVDAPRRGREQHVPPRIGRAAHPVDLLAEEEVALVERPDLVVGAASQEEAGPHDPLHLALALVVEARAVERVQRARARRARAEGEVLR